MSAMREEFTLKNIIVEYLEKQRVAGRPATVTGLMEYIEDWWSGWISPREKLMDEIRGMGIPISPTGTILFEDRPLENPETEALFSNDEPDEGHQSTDSSQCLAMPEPIFRPTAMGQASETTVFAKNRLLAEMRGNPPDVDKHETGNHNYGGLMGASASANLPHANFTRLVADFLRSGAEYVSHYIVLTPGLAQELLQRSRYDRQRLLDKNNVAGFLDRITKHKFRENTNIEVCITPDSQMHLVDGQHRLTAIARQSQPLPVCIQFCFVENSAAIQARYNSHDSAGKPRSLRDLIGNIGEEIGIGSKDADLMAVAVNHIRFGFVNISGSEIAKKMSKKDGEEVCAMMREWATEARILFDIYRSAGNIPSRKVFYVGPVIGVALATLRYQLNANEFWKMAILDDGLHQGDPAKTLLNWLLSDAGRAATPTIRARACSAAWGAHYEGRRLTKMCTGSRKSLVIAGTPVRIGGSA